jgi:hypothetical protein
MFPTGATCISCTLSQPTPLGHNRLELGGTLARQESGKPERVDAADTARTCASCHRGKTYMYPGVRKMLYDGALGGAWSRCTARGYRGMRRQGLSLAPYVSPPRTRAAPVTGRGSQREGPIARTACLYAFPRWRVRWAGYPRFAWERTASALCG